MVVVLHFTITIPDAICHIGDVNVYIVKQLLMLSKQLNKKSINNDDIQLNAHQSKRMTHYDCSHDESIYILRVFMHWKNDEKI